MNFDGRLVREFNQPKHRKAWGHEIWIANSNLYCGKKIFINADQSTSQHFHEKKTETLYVVSGQLKIELWEDNSYTNFILSEGDSYLVTPGLVHRLTAYKGDLVLHEFSTEHFEYDSYRVPR